MLIFIFFDKNLCLELIFNNNFNFKLKLIVMTTNRWKIFAIHLKLNLYHTHNVLSSTNSE